jgi:uncharacterized NAD(P)/FAD-binding protein YdhS
MSKDVKHTFAIIGCGLTGTSAFCQFTRKLQGKAGFYKGRFSDIRIVVIEKQDIFGPGFPHNERFVMPCHMTNTCAEDMGIISGKPRDFQDWVEAESDRIASEFTSLLEDPTPGSGLCNYYPRALVGEYLKSRFAQSAAEARKLGCDVVLYPRCEVLDATDGGTAVELRLRELDTHRTCRVLADRALIATGHWFRDGADSRYFPSTWPAWDLSKRIRRGERVAVLGTSLSAIDTALTLTSEGEFYRAPSGELRFRPFGPPGKIALCSRKGILPKVRGKPGKYRNRFLTQQRIRDLRNGQGEGPALENLFGLLRSDLEAVYGKSVSWAEVINPSLPPVEMLEQDLRRAREGDGSREELLWQTVLHQSFFMAREIYRHLSARDKERFEKRYSTLFFCYAAPMPPRVAEKLLALMRSEIVEVIKLGNDYTLQRGEEEKGYELSYLDARGNISRDRFAYLVDSRGQRRSFATSESELAQNLLRSGTVQIEKVPIESTIEPGTADSKDDFYDSGSLWIDPETHRVLRRNSCGTLARSECLYAVGIMTRGQILDASTAAGSALGAAVVTAQWSDLLDEPS